MGVLVYSRIQLFDNGLLPKKPPLKQGLSCAYLLSQTAQRPAHQTEVYIIFSFITADGIVSHCKYSRHKHKKSRLSISKI